MRRFLVLLVVFVLMLGIVSVVSAQGTDTSGSNNQNATQVTVTWDGTSNLTVSPNTVPANQPVQFSFAGQDNTSGSDAQGNFSFVIFQGNTGDNVFSANGQQAVMQGSTAADTSGDSAANANNTFTFAEAGSYTLAVYNSQDQAGQANQTFTRSQALATADFTVSAAAAQTTGTTTPSATGTTTAGATGTTTAEATTTTAGAGAATGTAVPSGTETPASTTAGQSGAASGQAPQTVPTTGGESAPWAMMALVLGALALIAGGALLATRPNR